MTEVFKPGQRVEATEDYRGDLPTHRLVRKGERGTTGSPLTGTYGRTPVTWDRVSGADLPPTRILRAVKPKGTAASTEPAEVWEKIDRTRDPIRVGDRIRVTHTWHGVKTVRTGTVARIGPHGTAVTDENFILTGFDDETIERLVVPEPPMRPLPTKEGTHIIATVRGVRDVVLVNAGVNLWRSASRIEKYRWHRLGDITAWRLAKVVPAE